MTSFIRRLVAAKSESDSIRRHQLLVFTCFPSVVKEEFDHDVLRCFVQNVHIRPYVPVHRPANLHLCPMALFFSWWPCRFHPLYSFLFLFPLESSPSSTHSSLLIHAPALTPFLLFFRSSIYSLRFFFYLIQVFPSWFTSLFLFSSSLYACVCYLLNISISLQTSSSSSPFFFTFLCVCVCLPHPISAVCRFRRFALLCSTQRMGCIYHTISSNRKYNSNSDGFPETNSRRAAMLLQLLYRGTYKTVRACTEPCKKKKAGNMCALQCNQ